MWKYHTGLSPGRECVCENRLRITSRTPLSRSSNTACLTNTNKTTIARTQHHSQRLSKVSLCLCEYPSKQVVHLPERGGTATTIPLEPIMLKPSSEKPPHLSKSQQNCIFSINFSFKTFIKKDTDRNQGHLPFFLFPDVHEQPDHQWGVWGESEGCHQVL